MGFDFEGPQRTTTWSDSMAPTQTSRSQTRKISSNNGHRVHQDHRRKTLRRYAVGYRGHRDGRSDQLRYCERPDRDLGPDLDPEAGKIVDRMEVGDSIFGGAVDIDFVHAQAELTQAGWNDVIFDFSQPVERWVTSYGRNEYIALSDSVTYDRIAIFIDWEGGEGGDGHSTSDTTYYIDDISGPGEGLSGGYTVPDGYILKFEDNFDDIGQAPDAAHWTLETGATGWGNKELQNYTDSTDNSVIVDVGVADGDTDRLTMASTGHSGSPPSVRVVRSPRHG